MPVGTAGLVRPAGQGDWPGGFCAGGATASRLLTREPIGEAYDSRLSQSSYHLRS
jgi:hypothetical protein